MLGMYASFWGWALFTLDPMITLPFTALMLFARGRAGLPARHPAHHRRADAVADLHDLRVDDPAPRPGAVSLEAGLSLGRPDARERHRRARPACSSGCRRSSRRRARSSSPPPCGGSCARTRLGAALEATAADKEAAALMGIDAQRMFALAWGIGAACAGVAGALLSTFLPDLPRGRRRRSSSSPSSSSRSAGSAASPARSGPASSSASSRCSAGSCWNPQYKLALVLALYLIVVLVRPQGLLGRA